MKILVYGGSFNPPTIAHKLVLQHFEKLIPEKYEKILILPVYSHQYSSKSSMLSYETRVNMLQIFCDQNISCKKCEISEFEKLLYTGVNDPGRAFSTAQIIQQMKQNEEAEYSLILGGDTFQDICHLKWGGKEGTQELLEVVENFEVVNRAELDFDKDDIVDNCFQNLFSGLEFREEEKAALKSKIFFNKVVVENGVSSTKARNSVKEENLKLYCTEEIVDFIKENELYSFSKK
eukprot:snap_masked-scaffold_36-processed-gene-2.91-mRNA-1 protein AED:1.00 eAED:1.00 QI:0/-1/0/0/-1/1/1/0/233